jgi:hypothetical protein
MGPGDEDGKSREDDDDRSVDEDDIPGGDWDSYDPD